MGSYTGCLGMSVCARSASVQVHVFYYLVYSCFLLNSSTTADSNPRLCMCEIGDGHVSSCSSIKRPSPISRIQTCLKCSSMKRPSPISRIHEDHRRSRAYRVMSQVQQYEKTVADLAHTESSKLSLSRDLLFHCLHSRSGLSLESEYKKVK